MAEAGQLREERTPRGDEPGDGFGQTAAAVGQATRLVIHDRACLGLEPVAPARIGRIGIQELDERADEPSSVAAERFALGIGL